MRGVQVDFAQLKQLCAFETGELKFTPTTKSVPNRFFPGQTDIVQNFRNVTSFLPFKLPKQHTVHNKQLDADLPYDLDEKKFNVVATSSEEL